MLHLVVSSPDNGDCCFEILYIYRPGLDMRGLQLVAGLVRSRTRRSVALVACQKPTRLEIVWRMGHHQNAKTNCASSSQAQLCLRLRTLKLLLRRIDHCSIDINSFMPCQAFDCVE